ncbi:unnamed protein product, partial [Cyprideis torosa]
MKTALPAPFSRTPVSAKRRDGSAHPTGSRLQFTPNSTQAWFCKGIEDPAVTALELGTTEINDNVYCLRYVRLLPLPLPSPVGLDDILLANLPAVTAESERLPIHILQRPLAAPAGRRWDPRRGDWERFFFLCLRRDNRRGLGISPHDLIQIGKWRWPCGLGLRRTHSPYFLSIRSVDHGTRRDIGRIGCFIVLEGVNGLRFISTSKDVSLACSGFIPWSIGGELRIATRRPDSTFRQLPQPLLLLFGASSHQFVLENGRRWNDGICVPKNQGQHIRSVEGFVMESVPKSGFSLNTGLGLGIPTAHIIMMEPYCLSHGTGLAEII